MREAERHLTEVTRKNQWYGNGSTTVEVRRAQQALKLAQELSAGPSAASIRAASTWPQEAAARRQQALKQADEVNAAQRAVAAGVRRSTSSRWTTGALPPQL